MILYTPLVGAGTYNPRLGALQLVSYGAGLPPAFPFIQIARPWAAGDRVTAEVETKADGLMSRRVWVFSPAIKYHPTDGYIIAPYGSILCVSGSAMYCDTYEDTAMYSVAPDSTIEDRMRDFSYLWTGYEWATLGTAETSPTPVTTDAMGGSRT